MERLRKLREEQGLSQQKLARYIGTTQQNIHRYENGYNEPDTATLTALANFFHTSIDYLVGNTDIRHKIEAVSPFDLNTEESLLVEKYRKLRPTARQSILIMMDELLQ